MEITNKTIFFTRITRGFGWGYSTTPDPYNSPYGIIPPTGPMYEGTPGQVFKNRNLDQTFNNLGAAFYAERYFAKGQPVKIEGSLLDLIDGDIDVLAATPITDMGADMGNAVSPSEFYPDNNE